MATRLNPIPTVLAVAALAGATDASAAPDQKSDRPCFASNTWESWTASGDGDVLYLRTGLRDIYRADLIRGSHVRKDPDRFLVTRVHGPAWICSALDLDLTLSDHHGFKQPIIVRSLRKLTPAEIEAIPRRDLP